MLLRSVRAVKTLFPGAKLFVADDTTAPKRLPKRVVRILSGWGVNLAPQDVPRNGNLRGWKCAKMIANVLFWALNVTHSAAVVKIDSDALMLTTDWVDLFLKSPATWGGLESKCKRAVCGPTYVLKAEAAAVLKQSYEADMESPYVTEEDFEMSSRLWRHYKGPGNAMKVPYAFGVTTKEWKGCQAGQFAWSRNIKMWRKWIIRHWSEVVMAAPRVMPEGTSDPVERIERALTANRERATMMKHLWNLKQQMI